jgi:chromosome segregation ATPase
MDQTKSKVELVEQQVGNLEVRLQDTDHCATNARAMLESKVDWEAMSSISSRLNAIVEQLNSNEQRTHDMHEKFESNERELERFKRGECSGFDVFAECSTHSWLSLRASLLQPCLAHSCTF